MLLKLFLSILCFSAFAEDLPQFKIINSEKHSAAGKSVQIDVDTKLPTGFHIYADQIKLQKIDPSNYQLGQIKISPPTEFYDKHSQKNRSGFLDQAKRENCLERSFGHAEEEVQRGADRDAASSD